MGGKRTSYPSRVTSCGTAITPALFISTSSLVSLSKKSLAAPRTESRDDKSISSISSLASGTRDLMSAMAVEPLESVRAVM